MAPARAFTELVLTKRFDKSFKRLSRERQDQCAAALEQLLEAPIPPGLRLKPIRPSNTYIEARINKGDRLVLYVESSTAYVMDVVTHDDIDRWSA